MSAPERQISSPTRSQSPGVHTLAPQRAFHAASSMSVDFISSEAPVTDDLVQLLMNSDDLRAVCCTPPRHRRQHSKNNLVVGAQLTQRERTPSPCLSLPGSEHTSPCLSVPSLDSLNDTDRPVRESSRTRRAPRSRQRSVGSPAGSLRSSSSTGQLLLVARHDDNDDIVDGSQHHRGHKSGSVGDLLIDDVRSISRSCTQAVSSQTATSGVDRPPRSDVVQLGSSSTNQDNISQPTDETKRQSQSQSTSAKHRQLSDEDVNDSHSSVNRSKSASSSSSSAAAAAASVAESRKTSVQGRAAQRRHSSSDRSRKETGSGERGANSRPARTVTPCQRSTTSQASITTGNTSITANSEKLFKEFDAIKKLKLFAGLGRHGCKNQRPESGGRVDLDVDAKQSKVKTTSAAGRSQTPKTSTASISSSAPTAGAKLLKSGTTNSTGARRPSAPRPGNGSTQQHTSTVVGGRQKTGRDGAKSRQLGEKAGSKSSA